MKTLRKLFKPSWKHKEFNPEKEIKAQNNTTPDLVEEYDSALTEIELRDR
ncbi:hypothetical protein [Phaeocystidibacter luteus]|nr:hypothetical protein [Phaeocystidibacter luteus]